MGKNKNLVDVSSPRILLIPAEYSDEQYLRAVLANAADAMGADPGAINVNTQDTEGETALHKACVWGDLRAVRLLLEAGAEIDSPGDMDCTPLYFAVMFGFSDVAEYLLTKGANPDALSEFGDTPRELAQTKGLSLQLLSPQGR